MQIFGDEQPKQMKQYIRRYQKVEKARVVEEALTKWGWEEEEVSAEMPRRPVGGL